MVAQFNSASTELKTSAHASMDAASIKYEELTQSEQDAMKTFKQVAKELKDSLSQSAAASSEHNPIARKLPQLTFEELLYVLGQYFYFGRKNVWLLYQAANTVSFYGWKKVNAELRRNINEEMAAPTDDHATHYAVLRRGALATFGVNVAEIHPGSSMSRFLEKIEAAVTYNCPSFVSGVLYGLEASATPEFVMTTSWAESLAVLKGVEFSGDFALFFETHRDEVEAGHEYRLLETIADHIQEDQLDSFRQGFTVTIAALQDMWQGVSKETANLASTLMLV